MNDSQPRLFYRAVKCNRGGGLEVEGEIEGGEGHAKALVPHLRSVNVQHKL